MTRSPASTRVRTLHSFYAADPRHAHRWAHFALLQHLASHAKPPLPCVADCAQARRYSLQSSLDGSTRVLPDSLFSLWCEGEVELAHLPELLHRLQDQLDLSDQVVHLSLNDALRRKRRALPWIYVALLGLAGLLQLPHSAALGLPLLAASASSAGTQLWLNRRFDRRRQHQRAWLREEKSRLLVTVTEADRLAA